MTYTVEKIENGILVRGLRDFNLEHIFECGQAFRWEKTEEGNYIVVAFDRVVEFEMDSDGNLYVYNSNEEDFVNIWHYYFDLDRDYKLLKKDLMETKAYKDNSSLQEAMDFGYGIRILDQEEFETTISFIISANNQIPRIKNSIRLLSEQYGDLIGDYKGKKYYAFPSPKVLAEADPEEIKEICRVGFRHERIVECAKMFVYSRELFSKYLSDQELGDNLLTVPGIGPKVRDCILLFGYGRGNTFPVDVWVKRLMETLYIKESIPNKKILEYSDILFGELRGFAQQYLFYYARENKIGK